MIWFSSDSHYFHSNIIKYCNRQFATLDEMHSELICRWNRVVKDGDIVYFLGDFSFGDIELGKEILAKLNGYKILISGNHDRGNLAMLEMGFNEVHKMLTLDIEGENVLLCHYPYRPLQTEQTSEYELKHMKKRPINKGKWLLHGHVHDSWKQKGKMINLSVEMWKYTPVSVDEIAQLIKAGPSDISLKVASAKKDL